MTYSYTKDKLGVRTEKFPEGKLVRRLIVAGLEAGEDAGTAFRRAVEAYEELILAAKNMDTPGGNAIERSDIGTVQQFLIAARKGGAAPYQVVVRALGAFDLLCARRREVGHEIRVKQVRRRLDRIPPQAPPRYGIPGLEAAQPMGDPFYEQLEADPDLEGLDAADLADVPTTAVPEAEELAAAGFDLVALGRRHDDEIAEPDDREPDTLLP